MMDGGIMYNKSGPIRRAVRFLPFKIMKSVLKIKYNYYA